MASIERRKVEIGGPVMRTMIAGYVILAIGVVLGLYFSWHSIERGRAVSSCISDWANATTSRNSILTELSSQRSHRLDLLVRDIALPARSRGEARRRFRRDLVKYIDASDNYNKALAEHPIPKPPSVRC